VKRPIIPLLVLLLVLGGCAATPGTDATTAAEPSATPRPTTTQSPGPSRTPRPTSVPTPDPTPAPIATPVATGAPTLAPTPVPTTMPAALPGGAIGSADAYQYLGQWKVVCGYVAAADYLPWVNGSPTFVNFDYAYPNQTFTGVIWIEFRAAYSPAPEIQFENRTVCVEGPIGSYNGRVQIVDSWASLWIP
jgi:hypothetical protein